MKGYELPDIEKMFHLCGLNDGEKAIVKTIIPRFAQKLFEKYPFAFERCTFFSDMGYAFLEDVVLKCEQITSPRIEGCDYNPFDQHYWLAFDVNSKQDFLVDPIFKYIGLQKFSGDKLDGIHIRYYGEKRIVPSDKPQVFQSLNLLSDNFP